MQLKSTLWAEKLSKLTQHIRQEHSPAHELLGEVRLIASGGMQRHGCWVKKTDKQPMDVALQRSGRASST